MHELLAAREVRVVALSKDSVKDAAYHKHRDALGITVLSDAGLEVIRLFGLEHHKAIEFSHGRFRLFGVSLALAPSIKTMAIPTSILVDEDHVIRWIDQADDYRLRSSEQRVLAAIDSAFGEAAAGEGAG